ncbi:MAG: hypothetical protein ACXWE9_11765 [Methylobacter sp.]
MAEKNVTSDGLLLHAKEFLVAAEILLNKTIDIQSDIQFPIYFLLGRSIELSLKAFLLSRDLTIREIIKLGHDINSLFDEALKRGLQNVVEFNNIEAGVIQVLNIDYKSKRLEYRDSGGIYYIPDIAITETVARKLVHGLPAAVCIAVLNVN